MLNKPVLDELSLHVVYPRHTRKAPEIFKNTGELDVPEGSTIEWTIGTTNLSHLEALFGDTSFVLKNPNTNIYKFK
jgi:hypothetical protein